MSAKFYCFFKNILPGFSIKWKTNFVLEKKLKGQSLSFLDEDMSIVIKKKKAIMC